MAVETENQPHESNRIIMSPCPSCTKPTAPSFQWHVSEAEWMCLECHHKERMNGRPAAVKGGAKLTRASSPGAAIAVKLVAMFLAVIGLFVGAICLFYKPHPMQPPPPLPISKAAAERKAKAAAAAKGLAASLSAKEGDGTGADGKPGGKSAGRDGKGGAVGVTAGEKKSPPKEKMAATVNALNSQMPTSANKVDLGKDGKPSEAIADLVEKGKGMMTMVTGGEKKPEGKAAAPAAGTPGGPPKPKVDIKEKLLSAKDSALLMAAAIIEKKDSDAVKTAEALGKLGAVSTTFADVANKLIGSGSEQAEKKGSGGSGSAGSAAAGTGAQPKLEADILETQGRAGYDAMDVMQREAAAEEAQKRVGPTVKAAADANGKAARSGAPGDAKTLLLASNAFKNSLLPRPAWSPPNAAGARLSGPGERVAGAGQPKDSPHAAGRLNAPEPKYAVNEARLHDTTIRLNELGSKMSETGVTRGKFNDPAIRLNDTKIVLNSTPLQLHEYALKLSDQSDRLHDTAIHLHDLTVRLNSTATLLHSAAVGTHASEIEAGAQTVMLNTLLVSFGAQSADEEASALAKHAAAVKPVGPPVQRIRTTVRARSLPANFGGATVTKAAAPAGKKAAVAQGPDVPVLILSMKASLLFVPDSAKLRGEAEAGLREVATVLICRAMARGPLPVLIRGSADTAGDADTAAALATRRAEVIRNWLTAYGCISAKSTSVEGRAVGAPAVLRKKARAVAAPADDPADLRVTITIPQEPSQTM